MGYSLAGQQENILQISELFSASKSHPLLVSQSLSLNTVVKLEARFCTGRLSEKEVTAIVSKLVLNFVDDKGSSLSRPLKFAVGYNRRGIEVAEMKAVKDNPSDPNLCALLVRNKCFSVVAAAVKAIVPDSVVDLKSPEQHAGHLPPRRRSPMTPASSHPCRSPTLRTLKPPAQNPGQSSDLADHLRPRRPYLQTSPARRPSPRLSDVSA
ncbi:hypothetical protein Cgig2_029443 [Carnegiea gigantea]|uniref:THUMP domain-containing protein n=1 Tax=Carnegiea gigantea TaxID=171969 RepID=A0A9Q1JY33_9CARY|nr:hypothetical protein Cgig2_029443 [Carnegiea gigantea]